ncbi:MAG: tetratricopeptide repeat protein, partial [Desulfatitalea sp.]|nr:tetratricopeptide repeat protein [Desulfatitalea sp.]
MRSKSIAALLCLGVVLLTIGAGPSAWASDQARGFLSGLEAYKAGDYAGAIDRFDAIVRSGVVNAQLYYNLGNAYLKNSELGPAILWYERALALGSGDPDLQFNLAYARSLTRDVAEEQASPLVRIFFFWNYQLSTGTIKMAAIGFNVLSWLLAGVWLLNRRRGLARAALLAAIPATIFALTAVFNYTMEARFQPAIVLPEQVRVRAGLEES